MNPLLIGSVLEVAVFQAASVLNVAYNYAVFNRAVRNMAKMERKYAKQVKAFPIPEVGEKFGKLTFISVRAKANAFGRQISCLWKCDCGNIEAYPLFTVRRGTKVDCGCTGNAVKRKEMERLVGQRSSAGLITHTILEDGAWKVGINCAYCKKNFLEKWDKVRKHRLSNCGCMKVGKRPKMKFRPPTAEEVKEAIARFKANGGEIKKVEIKKEDYHTAVNSFEDDVTDFFGG